MPTPVMAGVDGSAESFAAAEWAAREAVRRERPLLLLHARNWHPCRADGEPADAAQRQLARRALRRAEERVRRTCPAVRLSDEQVEGPASAALLSAADRAELLVLGSRGLSGFTGFLVGSVALAVVAKATCPVVLVRAGEEAADEDFPAEEGSAEEGGAEDGSAAGEGASGRIGHRDVVLGLDAGDPSDEVIEFAFEAARLRGARLRVLHAWQPPSAFELGPGDVALADKPQQGREWRGFLSAVLQVWRDKYPGVEVVECVPQDKASTALIRAASAAGLLVVGHRLAERPVGPRTGPVTHAVIHHVGCPVAVVPHP
ncbi:universal stress protein [Streptomyces sp. NPDC127119]|uniref:universal stress protein n=1 Tax=Streptomyces sp. NPDC127119 TaxID=3345370 RepID=UPI0036428EEE